MQPKQVEVALALGSNIGHKIQNLRLAVDALEDEGILTEIGEAAVYESEPMYLTDQDTFLNTVVSGKTTLSPAVLLFEIKRLENDLGRKKTVQNGPRLIDIDIILYCDIQISKEALEIPHPRMHERPFVLQPLADVLPNWIHPATEISVLDMLAALTTPNAVSGSLKKVKNSIR